MVGVNSEYAEGRKYKIRTFHLFLTSGSLPIGRHAALFLNNFSHFCIFSAPSEFTPTLEGPLR